MINYDPLPVSPILSSSSSSSFHSDSSASKVSSKKEVEMNFRSLPLLKKKFLGQEKVPVKLERFLKSRMKQSQKFL
jgi:hypothetical protein